MSPCGACLLRSFCRLLRRLDLLARLLQAFLKAGLATERRRPGARPDFHPVLGGSLEVHEPLVLQDGQNLRQKIVERPGMRHAEVRQRVGAGRNASADPPVCVVGAAEFLQFPGASDPLARRIKPERDKDSGIDRRAPRNLSPGPDRRLEPAPLGRDQYGQVQPLHHRPDRPSRVIAGKEGLQIGGNETDLAALGAKEARRSRRNRGEFRGRNRARFDGRLAEQVGGTHVLSPICQ